MLKFLKGNKLNNNQQDLIASIEALSEQIKADFDINISASKMLVDAQYRLTVLHELRTLGDVNINQQLDVITQLASINASSHQVNARSSVNLYRQLVIGLLFIVIAGASFAFYANINTQKESAPLNSAPLNTAPSNLAAKTPKQTAQAQSLTNALPKNSATKVPQSHVNNKPLTLPVASPEIVFRLHGSNTIGEKLAPALLEAFYRKQGVDTFYWQQGNHQVERTMQFIKDGKAMAVEVYAHGSGTAFKDMLNGEADIGMASRAVKPKELAQAKASLGDLSRVGNEHIIGLDGLAIIVNQNSPVKAMSIDVLAKIFSGEITNWAQIGQPAGEIKLFARDGNSGTWDTFNKLVLKKAGKRISPRSTRLESSSALSEQVSQDEYAIGFIGLNYIGHNKALAITEGKNATPIFPTKFTVGTEDYALSRRLYLYTPTSADALVKDFAQFAIGQAGQEIVDQVGLISQNIRLQKVYPLKGAPRSYNNYASKGQRLSLNFRFNHGNGDLDNKGQRDLLRLIEFIEQNPGRRLSLMGFSDSSGSQSANRQLSYRRAKAVEKELVARGIAVMSVEAYGEQLPVANNNTKAGRERNRRVEVWVI